MDEEKRYFRASDFFRNSKPASIVRDVRREMGEQMQKQVFDVNSEECKANRAYSRLANQVVGAEVG